MHADLRNEIARASLLWRLRYQCQRDPRSFRDLSSDERIDNRRDASAGSQEKVDDADLLHIISTHYLGRIEGVEALV